MSAGGSQGAHVMTLGTLLDNPACVGAQKRIFGLQLDSRLVGAGDAFLAMPGEVHDGRQFIEQAAANGAAAVIAEAPVAGFIDELAVPLVEVPELRQEAGSLAARFYHNPSRELDLVGITGTNGKTTTSRILAQLERGLGKRCGVIGTLGATLGDDVCEAGNTTPDPLSLQRQLATWRDEGVSSVALEVSSHALVQGRVNGAEFRTAIFTNLSHDHLDYHGTMEAYGRAKLQLFAWGGLDHAVVNLDDDFAPRVLSTIDDGVQSIGFSISGAPADVWVENIRFHPAGVEGLLCTPWGSGKFNSPLRGGFNLANLCAAISALLLDGEDLQRVLDAVNHLTPVPGRMEPVANDRGLQVIVDYAHTPEALEQVLAALRPHVPGMLVTVFGCGGDRDREKRQLMGRVACQGSDRVVLTSDNPRNERPGDILRDIQSGCSGEYLLEEDRGEAIRRAMLDAVSGDCVVIAGKGHEDYQIVEGQRLSFSDVEQVRAVLHEGVPR